MPISEVYLGDCMDYMRKMKDKEFDLAICDPPYGIGMGERKGRQSAGQNLEYFDEPKYKTSDWDDAVPDDQYFAELFRVSKNQIVFGANYFCDRLPLSRGWVFWDKSPIVPNYSDGELAWTSFDMVLKRKLLHWNGKMRTGTEPGYKSIHPTQKPIRLYKWLLKNYAKEGDKILDTHLGSQSSRIAAFDMGFDFTGYELDKDYFEAGNKRFAQHVSQFKLFTPEQEQAKPQQLNIW